MERPFSRRRKILALKAEIEKFKWFRKETPSAPPGNPKKQPSGKKDRPKCLLLNETPSNVNESRQWNNHTWYYLCKKTGGKCNRKWRQHQPYKCKGCAFVPNHKRKNTTAVRKKEKQSKLTEATQSILDQVNQEDSYEDSQEWSHQHVIHFFNQIMIIK